MLPCSAGLGLVREERIISCLELVCRLTASLQLISGTKLLQI